MMKRIKAGIFSIKTSLSNKPMALLLLLLVVILSVIVVGSLSKMLIGGIEERIYSHTYVEITNRDDIDIVRYGEALKDLKNNGFITEESQVSLSHVISAAPIKKITETGDGAEYLFNKRIDVHGIS